VIFKNLKIKNIAFYKRYYKLVAVATLVTIAVIVGSLVVGDSVRTTLVKRVNERLGNAETIIFSRNSFIENKMLCDTLFSDARGILVSNGFISASGKLLPVMVWGVDDANIPAGSAKINPHLSNELSQDIGSDIVLRLPATGLVPSGSLFVTDNYTTGLRLNLSAIIESENGGNLNLKNEQTIPFNIFVNSHELASALEIENKINLILSPKRITENELSEIWHYDLSGIKVDTSGNGTEITSDRIFIQRAAAETICHENPKADRLFSYLVNSIEKQDELIPYSFVTAVENAMQDDEIILSDYAANRLKATIGDTLRLTYYTSEDLKVLKTDTLYCRVSRIVPLLVFQDDSTLSANFPGLSNVESCTDWNSDLPIDMSLINQEDEDYWDVYRNTPKAIISYQAIAHTWGNTYGNATAMRIASKEVNLETLTYEMFGIQLTHPKENALYSAQNGVDFSSLFLALGFFIVISALLLMLVPLSEMLEQRKGEIALLSSLGYPQKRIVKLFWQESLPVVLTSSLVGVLTGLIYTFIIMWLLGNVWKGATHTDGFSVYPNMITVLIGLFSGLMISLLLLRITIVRSLKNIHRQAKKKKLSLNKKLISAMAMTILIISFIFINLTSLKSAALFVMAGVLALTAFALWGNYLICRNGSPAYYDRKNTNAHE
jgi:putative ABC transport system permease protein